MLRDDCQVLHVLEVALLSMVKRVIDTICATRKRNVWVRHHCQLQQSSSSLLVKASILMRWWRGCLVSPCPDSYTHSASLATVAPSLPCCPGGSSQMTHLEITCLSSAGAKAAFDEFIAVCPLMHHHPLLSSSNLQSRGQQVHAMWGLSSSAPSQPLALVRKVCSSRERP